MSTTSTSTPGFDERRRPLLGALADTDRSADAQPSELILRGEGMLARFQDVLHGDQPAQLEVAVHHQHALETVTVHERHGLVAGRTLAHRHQTIARRHDVANRLVEIGLEPEVAVGDDAHHAPRLVDHRQSADLVLTRETQHVADRHIGTDRDRILHHAALEALHLRDFGRLELGGTCSCE